MVVLSLEQLLLVSEIFMVIPAELLRTPNPVQPMLINFLFNQRSIEDEFNSLTHKLNV